MQGHEQPEKQPTRWPASTTPRQPPTRRETRAPPRPAATTAAANLTPPQKQIHSPSSPAPPLHDRRPKTRHAVLAGALDALRAFAVDSRPTAPPSRHKRQRLVPAAAHSEPRRLTRRCGPRFVFWGVCFL